MRARAWAKVHFCMGLIIRRVIEACIFGSVSLGGGCGNAAPDSLLSYGGFSR
jgi:hypothetical protein